MISQPYDVTCLVAAADVVHLDGEVVDAGPLAGGLRFRRFGPGVVLDERDVEHAVGEVARGVVAHFLRVHFLEAEHLLVELGGALEVVDLQREMHDATH